MPKHGTACTFGQYSFGQYSEVLTAVIKAMPRALEGTDPKTVIAGLENRGEALGLALNGAIVRVATTSAFSPYPANGVEFELTFNFDALAADSVPLVRADGYDPKGWNFTGQKMSGIQTRRFKLVEVGTCSNLDEVRHKLAQYGEVPEGQWREAFKAVYLKTDGKGPIGFADPSWVHPNGFVYFPFVDWGGESSFGRAVHGRMEWKWRWLVPADK